jgi:rod shape-determining protein MreC
VSGSVFSRRRVLLGLVLTALLLITLDLRGNPVIDGAREGFGRAFQPVRDAAQAVVRPVRNAWQGVFTVDDLRRENAVLRDEIERQRGAAIAAEASVREAQELLALNGMQTLAGLETVTARVVGLSPSNWMQTIEIDQGRDRGIRVGMPVVNAAGLVGKVTRVSANRSVVMLVTDRDFTLAVKVVNPVTEADGATVSDPIDTRTLPRDPLARVQPRPGETTWEDRMIEPDEPDAVESDAGGGVVSDATTSAGVSVLIRPGLVPNDTGALEGQGADQRPRISLIEGNPRLGGVRVGAVVMTAGGISSVAPPDIVVGRVSRVVERPGSGGPLLDVELSADVTALNFVRVLLYRPALEEVR